MGALLLASAGCVIAPLQDGDLAGDDVLHFGGYASKPGATIEVSMRNPADQQWDVVQTVQSNLSGTTIAGDTLYRFDTVVDIAALGSDAYGTADAQGVRYELKATEDEVQDLLTFDEDGIDCVMSNLGMGWVNAGAACYHEDAPVVTIYDRLYGPPNTWWHAALADVPDDLDGLAVTVGDTAPNVLLSDQNGDELELYQLYGHVIIVKLFTAWCEPCQTSAPHGEELWVDYKDDGLEFVSVMLQDTNSQPPDDADIDEWIDAFGITHPVVPGPSAGWTPVTHIPTYVIIDRDMNVVYKESGLLDDDVALDLL